MSRGSGACWARPGLRSRISATWRSCPAGGRVGPWCRPGRGAAGGRTDTCGDRGTRPGTGGGSMDSRRRSRRGCRPATDSLRQHPVEVGRSRECRAGQRRAEEGSTDHPQRLLDVGHDDRVVDVGDDRTSRSGARDQRLDFAELEGVPLQVVDRAHRGRTTEHRRVLVHRPQQEHPEHHDRHPQERREDRRDQHEDGCRATEHTASDRSPKGGSRRTPSASSGSR